MHQEKELCKYIIEKQMKVIMFFQFFLYITYIKVKYSQY